MFPSTGRYDHTSKRDKVTKQQIQYNYNLPMDHFTDLRQSQQQSNQLHLDDEKYFLLSIIKAHEETCDYTKDKVTSLIDKSRKKPIYVRCPSLMSCPLNPLPGPAFSSSSASGSSSGEDGGLEDFSERFSPAIRGVVEFAKRIPGFGLLSQDDQVTLLKAGVFEVLLIRLACMFDTDSMFCLNGMVLKRESLHSQDSARLLIDSMFAFTERLNSLHLTDSEIALFCSIVIISPDRPGLHNIDLIDKINRKCVDLLNQSIKANHHSSNCGLLFNSLINRKADLRNLNQLHSEKLLAYKMGPKNGQNYNNLSSSSQSPSPISSSSSSSSSSPMSSLNHHKGNSNSSSSNGDRNCNSPGNMNNTPCSCASVLPVQWQNFTIRDNQEGPTSSSSSCSTSSSSSSSYTFSSRMTNNNNNNHNNNNSSHGVGDDESLSYDRNSVTSSDNILNSKSSKSANGLNNSNNSRYSKGDYHYQPGHNQPNNNSSSSSQLANQYILGQRLLQSSNNTTNNSSSNNNINSNSLRDKNSGSTRECPINNSNNNSLNHHNHNHNHNQHPHPHPHPHHPYDNFTNGSTDVYTKMMRRVDSPTDSGIESGKEQCNGSTPTASVCSSPRSACDDKVKDIVSDSECSSISEKNTVPESIDDMPMLKRALQAPPLINTNMLMDEAYRHHKKFRATKASRDCEPASSTSNSNHCLASPTSTSSSSSSLSSSTSSLYSSSSCPPSNSNNNCDSLASTHSTLVKVLESAPRYIGDLSAHHHQYPSPRHPSSSPPHNNNNNNYTSMKKCDLLHSLITKGGNGGSANVVDGSNQNGASGNETSTNGVVTRVGDSMPPPLDLSRKRDLLYL